MKKVKDMPPFHSFLSHCLVLSVLFTFGCAGFRPLPVQETGFRDRAESHFEKGVRVTAAVLTAEETRKVFDLDLYRKGIQPVWLQIENTLAEPLWFLPAGMDPDYFPPLEVAYMHHFTFAKNTNDRMDRYFLEQGMGQTLPPGRMRSGFVFTNLDGGTKALNVDIIGTENRFQSFAFLLSVPDFPVSYQDVAFHDLYSKDQVQALNDAEEFRKALEGLPCCTKKLAPGGPGEPLNLVVVGKGRALLHMLVRRGWDETGRADGTSGSKRSSLRAKYRSRYEPVATRLVFGRSQDAAFRKTRESTRERNQIRLWLSPLLFQDQPVWVGQVSREVKTRHDPEQFTPEPLLDEARTYLLQDLWYSQGLVRFGYVRGGHLMARGEGQGSEKEPSTTDGYLLVLWVGEEPIAFTEVENIGWETPGAREGTTQD